MRRVAVVGCGGAGKSTFAAELGRRLGLPVIHLDRLYWKPCWVPSAREEFAARQAKLAAAESWIMDGNYSGTMDVRFVRADTVIILALPRWRCLTGVARRWLAHHGQPVQAAGCPERPTREFLRWIWRFQYDARPRLDAAIARHRDRLRVVELTSRRQVRDFLAALPAAAADRATDAGSALKPLQ